MRVSTVASIVAFASVLVSVANAQIIGAQEVWRVTPEERRMAELSFKASTMAHRARELFRKGQSDAAERLATEALQVYEPVGLSFSEGDDVLAEIAMARKNPREALRLLHDVPEMPDGVLSFRGQTTRVLALLAIGRVEDARSFLLRVSGTLDEPSEWRCAPGVWDLPMDGDASPRALAATAYLLRADSHQQFLSDPEVFDDLREAERLAPGAVAVRLMLARCLLQRERLDEAERYYTLVAAVNEPRARKAGKLGLQRIRETRAWRAANPPG